jgi:hypothetical protein
MKKQEMVKKLALSRETLVRLSSPEMKHAGGGAWSDVSICPGTTTTRATTYTQETC